MLTKKTAKPPVRKKRTVAALGDEVIVRAISIPEFLTISSNETNAGNFINHALAVSVIGGDGEPIYDASQWNDVTTSVDGRKDAETLYQVFRELNEHLFDEEPAKN